MLARLASLAFLPDSQSSSPAEVELLEGLAALFGEGGAGAGAGAEAVLDGENGLSLGFNFVGEDSLLVGEDSLLVGEEIWFFVNVPLS